MEALERLAPLEKKSVLDVGTGTGILSMASILLGTRSAVALDIDNDAILTCSRNAALNKMYERLWTFQGTVDALKRTAQFDLVLANVHGDIILKEAHRLVDHTREGGHMILSGLDYTDNRQLKTVMGERGMKEISILFLEEFVTQVWRRPQEQD